MRNKKHSIGERKIIVQKIRNILTINNLDIKIVVTRGNLQDRVIRSCISTVIYHIYPHLHPLIPPYMNMQDSPTLIGFWSLYWITSDKHI